jgi:hypothetical protein
MNVFEKDGITSLLATKITQIFTTNKPKPPIFLTCKAETNEEEREERIVEEGRNSLSQESGLNGELAGNNNHCKVISVSDSVTSAGCKESESESEGGDLNTEHQKEHRRILGQDVVIFYGHNS